MLQMKSLRRQALRLCRNAAEGEDLVQDTVLRALTKRDQYQPGTNLAAWMFTILRNTYLSNCRKSGRLVGDPDGLLSAHVRSSSDPVSAYEAKDAISFIVLLPEAQQRALMAAANGLSLDDIAAREGVPVGTVKSRVSRARTALAEMLKAPEYLQLGAEA